MKYLIIMSVFFCTVLCAENLNSKVIHTNENVYAALRIVMEQPESIEAWTESRVYLKPSRVHLTKRGVFLRRGESSIQLPNFGHDKNGLFMFCKRAEAEKEAQEHFDKALNALIDFIGECAAAGLSIEVCPPYAIYEGYQAVESFKEACREYNEGCAIRDGNESTTIENGLDNSDGPGTVSGVLDR